MLGQRLVNKNVLLFGRRGSGKTMFLNQILPLFTSFQPTLGISRPSNAAVTLALQKFEFMNHFRAGLPLTLFDTYGLTNTNYGDAVFRLLINGYLNVKHGPAEYGFTENDEPKAFAALIQPSLAEQKLNWIDIVLFFVARESTEEQIEIIKTYIQLARADRKKAIVIITSRSEAHTENDLSEISSKFAEEGCRVMHWLHASSFIAQQQLLHILLHCVNSEN